MAKTSVLFHPGPGGGGGALNGTLFLVPAATSTEEGRKNVHEVI